MNQNHNMILIKGEDKTSSVESWRFDRYRPIVFMKYKGGKEYPYNTADVCFLKEPRIVVLNDQIALKDNAPLSGVASLQFFDEYCRIVYKTG